MHLPVAHAGTKLGGEAASENVRKGGRATRDLRNGPCMRTSVHLKEHRAQTGDEREEGEKEGEKEEGIGAGREREEMPIATLRRTCLPVNSPGKPRCSDTSSG